MGIDEFKRQVEERLGKPMASPSTHQPFTKNIDDFSGWVKGDDGLYSHTIFIENGMTWSLGFVNTSQVESRIELSFGPNLVSLRSLGTWSRRRRDISD
jgi:sulfite reductase beta subunit-like hemoprotein